MVNSVFRPTKPHFFQPMLPGFINHLTIPVAFFFKYLEEKKPTSALLRSNGCEKRWRVKIDDRRFTDGWKEFVTSHDLHVGDILLFRHEGNMVFHVILFGPSGCQKHNAPFCGPKQENECPIEETEEERKKDSRKKRTKQSWRKKAATWDTPSFVATVAPSSLKDDRMFFPRKFARSNALHDNSGTVLMMNEHKRIWKSGRICKKSDGRVYIKGCWRDFCVENDLKAGDLYGFKLSWNARTPAIKLMVYDECLEASREFLEIKEELGRTKPKVPCAASGDLRFVTLTATPSNFRKGRQLIPTRFARSNNLKDQSGVINLMDKNRFCWQANLCHEKKSGRMFLGRSWRSYCAANDLKEGDSFTLELIRGKKLMLRFCSKVKPKY